MYMLLPHKSHSLSLSLPPSLLSTHTHTHSLSHTHSEVYSQLVSEGLIVPQPEVDPPTVPMDYKWAQELGLIRKPAAFLSSICDERGEELLYAGMPISDVFKDDIGIGGVLSLLWFQRRLVMLNIFCVLVWVYTTWNLWDLHVPNDPICTSQS